MDVEPSSIAVDADGATITWTDGVTTAIAGRRLRAACPCAECREHEERNPSFIEIGGRHRIADAQLIGGYALRFTFGDGHADGIYPYGVLRDLSSRVAE